MAYLDEFARQKGFRAQDLARYGVHDDGDGIVIPYHLGDGSLAPRFQLRNGKGFTWNAPSEEPIVPYGLERPVPYLGGNVIVTEGPSDCWALWLAHIPAIGIPGAHMESKLTADMLAGVDEIGVTREPGKAGAHFPERVAARCREIGFAGVVSALDFHPYKDARDAMIAHPSDFGAFVRGVWARRTPVVIAAPPTDDLGLLTTGQLRARVAAHAAMDWRVDGLLAIRSSMIVGAKVHVGKSVLLANLALAVARGAPFLGRPTRQGRVLYVSIDEEEGITTARADGLGIRDDEPGLIWFAERGTVPVDWEPWLARRIEEVHPDVVIIDTVAKLTHIEEINSYGQWVRLTTPLDRLAETHGFAYVVAHHNVKNGKIEGIDALVGSGVIGGCFATALIVTADRHNEQRSLQSDQRFGHNIEKTRLLMDPTTFVVTLGETQRVIEDARVQRSVYDVMGDGVERSGPEIRLLAGVREQAFYAQLNSLLANGALVRGRRGRYRLADTELPTVPAVPTVPGTSDSFPTLPKTSALPQTSGDREAEAEVNCQKSGIPCDFPQGPADAVQCTRCGWLVKDHDGFSRS